MRLRHLIPVLTLAIFLAAPTPAKEPPPVAQCPTWQVGDWWEFTDGLKDEVTQVTDKGYVVRVTRNGDEIGEGFYTLDLRLVKYPYESDDMIRSLGGWELFKWPIRVGQKWEQHTTATDGNGYTWDTVTEFEVVAYKKVHTWAGRMWAYKIRYFQKSREKQSRFEFFYWYAPQAKRVIILDMDQYYAQLTVNLKRMGLAEQKTKD